MRGEKGSSIKLRILRKGVEKPLEITLIRDRIQIRAVRWREEGEDKTVGYIRITSFTEKTAETLKQAIDDLTKKISSDKLKGFIIDLRNNPGGLLESAVDVSDTFLERGEIVSTRGRNAEETQRRSARPGRPDAWQAADRADQRRFRPRPRKSSPAPCRISSAPPFLARAPSAKAPSRPSSRCRTGRSG